MNKEMWEILVPAATNEGTVFDVAYHRLWDEQVHTLAGGSTILATARGTWTDDSGEMFKEAVIPVRILCTRDEIKQIIDMTMEHYEQIAVMAYKISDDVILKYRNGS